MKENSVQMAILFDFYGEILTPKQREFFDLYHNEDLSLSEIAENANITRQGVRDVIVRGEAVLTEMEEKLGLADRVARLTGALGEIRQAAEIIAMVNERRHLNAEIRDQAERIIKLCSQGGED